MHASGEGQTLLLCEDLRLFGSNSFFLFFFLFWSKSSNFSQWHLQHMPHAATYSHTVQPQTTRSLFISTSPARTSQFTLKELFLPFCSFYCHFPSILVWMNINMVPFHCIFIANYGLHKRAFPCELRVIYKQKRAPILHNAHFDVNQNIFELKHILFLIHTSPFDVTSTVLNKSPALCRLLINVILPPLCLVWFCHFNNGSLFERTEHIDIGGGGESKHRRIWDVPSCIWTHCVAFGDEAGPCSDSSLENAVEKPFVCSTNCVAMHCTARRAAIFTSHQRPQLCSLWWEGPLSKLIVSCEGLHSGICTRGTR